MSMRSKWMPALAWAWCVGAAIGACESGAERATGVSAELREQARATPVADLGVTMELPSGSAIERVADDVARVRVPGLPELEIRRHPNPSGQIVRGTSGARGAVTVKHAIKDAVWTCRAERVDNGVRLQVEAVCNTMTPPEAPRVTAVRCRDARGNIDAAREAWVGAAGEALVGCLRPELARSRELERAAFSIEAHVGQDGALVERDHVVANAGTIADQACFARVAGELRSAPGYRLEGLDPTFKCVVNLGRR